MIPVHEEQAFGVRDPNSGIGSGAAAGAVQGLGVGATPLYMCHPELTVGTLGLSCLLGLSLAVVTVPVGTVVGAGVGAGIAHTEEEVEAASANIDAALAEARLTEGLFDYLRAAGGSYRVGIPPTAEGTALTEIGGHEGVTQDLSDSRIEIGITHMRIESRGDWDPDLSIVLSARARLVRASDQVTIYQREWKYRSPSRDYFEVAEDDASLLRSMIDTGLSSLADAIVTDLFVKTEPEIHADGPVPAGEVWTTMVWSATARVTGTQRTGAAQTAAATQAEQASGSSATTTDETIIAWSAPSDTATLESLVVGHEPLAGNDTSAIASESQLTDPVLVADPPPEQSVVGPDYFGAIAITTKTVFRSGVCVDQPTAQLAESCALRECGSFCEVRAVFGSGQCAAIAGTRGRQRPEDVAIGSSAATARETAITTCRSHPQLAGRSYWSNTCQMMERPSCNLTTER